MKIIRSGKTKQCLMCSGDIPMGDRHYHQRRGGKHFHLECIRNKRQPKTIFHKFYNWMATHGE